MQDAVRMREQALARAREIVGSLPADAWSAPTPCGDWDLRALANHVTWENEWAVELLAGRTVDEVGSALDGDRLGDDPAAAFDRAAVASEAAWRAATAEQVVHLSRGPTPAVDYLGEMLIDAVIHTWDIAKGAGADPTIASDAAETLWSALAPKRQGLEAAREFGAFASEVEIPDDAPAANKVLGLLGRDPTWAPPS